MIESARPKAHHPDDTTGLGKPGRMSTAKVLAVLVGALALGTLLNAGPLSETAAAQRPGWQRQLALTFTDVASEVSSAMRLDEPRQWIDEFRDSSDEGTTGSTVRQVFTPATDLPARLWVAGDSLVNTFGPALVEAAEATDVVEARWDVRYSSGLTRPMLFDWESHVGVELGNHPADIVVFMIGANDAQPILAAGEWESFPGDAWRAEYRTRVAAMMENMTDRAATVYWVGQPIARSERQSQRASVMNDIYRTEAELRPRVRYIDAWELFADANGNYAAYLPDHSGREALMRDADGVHLSVAGAEHLARTVLEAIRMDWSIS